MFVGGTGLRWFALAGAWGRRPSRRRWCCSQLVLCHRPAGIVADPFADPLGEGHQTIQSLYAIASGGLVGWDLGNSRQNTPVCAGAAE